MADDNDRPADGDTLPAACRADGMDTQADASGHPMPRHDTLTAVSAADHRGARSPVAEGILPQQRGAPSSDACAAPAANGLPPPTRATHARGPTTAQADGPLWTGPVLAERPIRLITPPEEVRVLYAVPEGPPARFVWRRQTVEVARHAGPERIAPEWWQDRPGTRLRDYFKIEDRTGRRLWIYREGLVHDGRGGLPRWFLHGIFA